MRLKPILIASAAYFALTLVAYAESASSQTNGVPGGTISTPGSEAKSNPIPVPPAAKSGESYVIVTPAPEAVPPPPPPPQ